MLSKELKRILKLVKKTGDRVVIYDSQEPEDSFMIMGISAYESLVGEKSEMNFKQEIKEVEALKYNEEKELKLEKKNDNLDIEKVLNQEEKKGLTEEDLTDKINHEISLWKNQENPSFVAGDEKLERPTKPWSIPPKVKEKAKEVE